MNKQNRIKILTQVVKTMSQKTIFTDENGAICAPPSIDDYDIDSLMIFNHGKLEAYKEVLKMFENEMD